MCRFCGLTEDPYRTALGPRQDACLQPSLRAMLSATGCGRLPALAISHAIFRPVAGNLLKTDTYVLLLSWHPDIFATCKSIRVAVTALTGPSRATSVDTRQRSWRRQDDGRRVHPAAALKRSGNRRCQTRQDADWVEHEPRPPAARAHRTIPGSRDRLRDAHRAADPGTRTTASHRDFGEYRC